MDTASRKKYIFDLLQEKGTVNVSELANELKVSTMTIRRDLSQFAKEGIVSLEHGGALLIAGSLFEYSMGQKGKIYLEEKKRIAQESARHINEGDCVYIDAGTTPAEVARLLLEINKKDITVISHSLLVANILSQNESINFIMCPGQFRHKSMAYMGQMTDDFIERFKIDKLFLWVEGINIEDSVTVPDISDGATKKSIIKCSKVVICVADSSKFKNDYLYKIEKTDNLDVIITDKGIDEEIVRKARKRNINLLTV